MKLDVYKIIKRPIITEKSNMQNDQMNQVVFMVNNKATKHQIKNAVEKLFKIKVLKVNTLSMRGKSRRIGPFRAKKPNWKKAVVTLAKGDSIDFYETV